MTIVKPNRNSSLMQVIQQIVTKEIFQETVFLITYLLTDWDFSKAIVVLMNHLSLFVFYSLLVMSMFDNDTLEYVTSESRCHS